MTWFRNFRSSVHDIYSCDLLQQAISALYAKILIILGEMQRKVRNLTCLIRSVSAPHRCPLSQYFSGVLSIFLHFPLHWKSQLYLLRIFPTFHKKVKLRLPKKVLCLILLVRFYARLIRRKPGNSTTHEDFLLHETMHKNGVHHGRIYLKVGTISQNFI